MDQQPNTMDASQTVKHKLPYWILGAIFLLAVASAIICRVYYWQVVSAIPASFESPVHKEKIDQTANWNTYTSDKFGFEIQYPNDWTVDDKSQKDYVFFVSPERMNNMKNVNYEGLAGDLMFNNQSYLKNSAPDTKKTLTIGSNVFTQYSGGEVYETANFELTKDNKIYRFESAYDFDNHIISQIISTFKFTSSTPANIQTKVYNSAQYGYQFSYPDNWTVAGEDKYLYVSKNLSAPIYNDVALQIDLACIYATEGPVDPVIENSTVKYGNKVYKEQKIYDTAGGDKKLVFDFVSFDLPSWYKNLTIPDINNYYFNNCATGTFIISPTVDRSVIDKIISTFKFTK